MLSPYLLLNFVIAALKLFDLTCPIARRGPTIGEERGGLVIPYPCNSLNRYPLSLKVPRMLSLKVMDHAGGGAVVVLRACNRTGQNGQLNSQ